MIAATCALGAPAAHADLVFERADGSVISFAGAPRVWCGPWEADVKRRALHVVAFGPITQRWQLSVVRRDLELGKRLRFPNEFIWDKPHGARLFVGDAPNEASTQEEESKGSIVFTRASCRPGRAVVFRANGVVVGSEFIDGEKIRVSGTFRGRVTG
jgi:hypothetical protein